VTLGKKGGQKRLMEEERRTNLQIEAKKSGKGKEGTPIGSNEKSLGLKRPHPQSPLKSTGKRTRKDFMVWDLSR